MDKTLTRFGQRLLRKWVGRPLLDKERLEERVAAVEELLDNTSTAKVDQLENILKTTRTDLERSLIRIYYGKCTRPELLAVLQTLQKIASEFARVEDSSDTGFKSTAISNAIASLPLILPTVLSYLERINAQAARADDKYAFFRETEETDAITDHKLGIASVEQELDAHRQVASSKLNKKSPISYVTVAGIEYLVEVSNADLKHVPASWIKISGTKKLSRFHTPEVVRLMSERDQHREALSAACDAAFASLLQSIASDYQPLRDAISSLATLDCLLSLSKVAALPGYTKPEFLPPDTPAYHLRDRWQTPHRRANTRHLLHPLQHNPRVPGPSSTPDNGTQHGREILLRARRRAPRSPRTNRLLRPRRLPLIDARRRNPHAHGSPRQPVPRREHLHGRSLRDRAHPAFRHAAVPRNTRRARPRNKHVRRRRHRPGCSAARRRGHALSDPLHHPLPKPCPRCRRACGKVHKCAHAIHRCQERPQQRRR